MRVERGIFIGIGISGALLTACEAKATPPVLPATPTTGISREITPTATEEILVPTSTEAAKYFTPTVVPPTETPPPPPTATTAPIRTPEQAPVVSQENLKRYGVYTGTLGNKNEGEILFYPLFQDQALIAFMYKSQDGTKYFHAIKGVVSKQPGTGQFQISYNEASRLNISAVVVNGSSVGVLKSENYPEGLKFSADPTGGEGAQALAQAWINMAGRVFGAIYTPDSALQEIETISGAKIPR